ncbi:MAG: TRAP transporter substrate-binding protein [Formivibrio sp.]|nr:TRAP transporter substrate-binding protein [Formivibrio sp.]
MNKKYLGLLTGLAMVFGTQSALAVEKMRLSHGLPEDHPVHKAVVKFADLVKQRTNGEIQITVYANGVLGSELETLQSVKTNGMEFTKASAATLETLNADYKVFNLPFIFRDRAHFFKVLEGPVGESILAASKKSGFIGLAYYDSGARSFYGKKPIETPDDLKGAKIRVQQSPTTIKMIQALGGTPVPMAWGEVYSALQLGLVDMAENNVTALTSGRHGEVAKFYSDTEHQMVPDVLVMSVARWDALTKPQQDIIKQAAVESFHLQKQLWAEAEKTEKAKAEKMGVKFSHPNKQLFIAKVKPMIDEERKNPSIAKLLDEIAATK